MTDWENKFYKLKKDYDKELVERMKLVKQYNGLLDDYNKLLETKKRQEEFKEISW